MLNFWSIPAAVLLGAALFILLLNRGKPNIGLSWFTAILAALFVWGWTVSIYWRADFLREGLSAELPGVFSPWTSSGDISGIGFILDRISYPYMLAVSALLVVLLLTAPSYMEPQTAPRLWFFYLVIEAIGYLSVSASRLSFVIFGWTIFDGIDLVTRYLQIRPEPIPRGYLRALGVRFFGTVLASASMAYSVAEPEAAEGLFVSAHAGVFLMLACALRIGIFPISQPYSEMSSSRVGLGTMLRLVSALTVIPVMSRVPLVELSPNMGILLSITGGLASLVGAVGWLLSEDSFSGISYAALAISGMAFVSALSRDPEALTAWGISIVLTCAPLSLYRVHNIFMNILASLLVICFSGLPFTPNAVGWRALVGAPYSPKDLLFILVMLLLIAGAFIHILRSEGRKFTDLEPWMRSVYPLGILAAVGTHVFISYSCYDEMFSMGVIPASVSAFSGGVLLAAYMRWLPERFRTQNVLAWAREGISLFWRMMQRLLDMNWLFSLGRILMRVLDRLVRSLTRVIENNGGLVWEFLLLAFLLAAAFSGGLH